MPRRGGKRVFARTRQGTRAKHEPRMRCDRRKDVARTC
ncbi:hypothetical protein SAMCFNEI73_pC1184 (plasmid) [Sinorhizobium americanum]|uniref:Uncharacterized protein n=1 Tax=Sinorhizobium americanum TaxID=194963 RepID=A0A1L3LXZ6_9HYPH|nr:hypothetical protein SAMCFNEI73_pC1184 [Sinorhizobium americanum]